MDITTTQELFSAQDTVPSIVVMVNNPDNVAQFQKSSPKFG